MVTNLLDNAAKYGLRAGGRLDVLVEFAPQSVRLRFADDGPGIPPALRERVFDRFFRLEGHQSPGCGLGLAIVADVAEAHGGTARCTSERPGTAFDVVLAR